MHARQRQLSIAGTILVLTCIVTFFPQATQNGQTQLQSTLPIASSEKPVLASIPVRNTQVVVIDPGHGGDDNGTTSIDGYAEKTLTLAVATDIADDLRTRDIQVIMTRTTDVNPSLAERLAIGLAAHPAFFLSVHANSFADSDAIHGLEIHVYDPKKYASTRYPGTVEAAVASERSEEIAEDILSALQQHPFGITLRGIRYDTDYVCRLNSDPSALIELGYLSNPGDARLLRQPSVQRAVAADIADGIWRAIERQRTYLPLELRFRR